MTGYRVQLLAAALTMCVCQVIETTEIEANEKNMDIALHDIEPRAIGDCGGSFVNDSGQFSSPGYPNLYNNYENCIYYITVSIGYSVQLDFTLFHTEATHDAVKIYETYPSVNADAEYSGSTLPETYVSLGWTLTVQFTSDGSITYQGFLATYYAVTSNQENTLGDCGGSFTRDSGFFASPSYPSDYPDSQDCYYYIAVSEGSVVTLEFTMFETELCCDTVEIFDGNTVSSTSLGQYSGTWIVSQITSSGRSLVVHFHSDGSVTGRGFFATYSTGSGGSDGRNGTSQYSVAVIAAGVPGTTVIIVTALIFVVCCCKQKSSISPITNTTNRATARTQAEPRETAPLSTSLTGYYQPSAPANHNTYNNPTFGQDKGQGYPQPPGMGIAPDESTYPPPFSGSVNDPTYPPGEQSSTMYPPPPQGINPSPESTYPPPLPGSMNDPAYPPPGHLQPLTMYPPPPQGINPPTPAAYNPMYPPPPQPSTEESNPSAPPPAYDAAVNNNK